jgi:signal transduction histidine kinase
MKINDRINRIYEELGYAMIRKNKSGDVIYKNKFLDGKDLELCNFIKSEVEPNVYYISLYENLELGVYSKRDNNVEYVNKYLSRMTDGVKDIERYIQETIIKDKVYIQIQGNDQEYFMTHTSDGDYNFLYDNTGLVQLEMHLDTIEKLFEINQREKKMFVSNITHDLRTPLSSIISLLSLLSSSSTLKQQQRYIKMMKECSFNLLEIVNDILDYTKLEIGDIILNTSFQNIRKIVDDITLIVKEMISKKSIRLNTFVSIDIPDTIDIDIKRLKQVILNIVSHSLLYTESGSLEIRVNSISRDKYIKVMEKLPICKRCKRYACHLCQNKVMCYCEKNKCICCQKGVVDDSESMYLQFDIIDTGIKIPKDKMEVLFTNNSNNFSGLLGMYIVNRLVYLMDGNLFIDQDREIGNRYTFVMRVNKTSRPNISELLKSKFIMIIVNDTDLRVEFLTFLSKYTQNIISVSSIEEANFYVNQQNIDTILGDTRDMEISRFMTERDTKIYDMIGYGTSDISIEQTGGHIRNMKDISEDSFIKVLTSFN